MLFLRTNRNSTPLRQYLGGASMSNTPNSSQRFVPRPSPERLAAQVKSVEATQELMMDMMSENNKKLVDEIKAHR